MLKGMSERTKAVFLSQLQMSRSMRGAVAPHTHAVTSAKRSLKERALNSLQTVALIAGLGYFSGIGINMVKHGDAIRQLEQNVAQVTANQEDIMRALRTRPQRVRPPSVPPRTQNIKAVRPSANLAARGKSKTQRWNARVTRKQ